MKIVLKKKPKGATLIEGFPGFGLVGTIVTEFLIDHLKCEKIGEFIYDDLPATVAIHKGELIYPMSVFYNKKYNVLILHTILDVKGFEWEVADVVAKMCTDLEVKETISLEGVTGSIEGDKIYSFQNKKFEKLGAENVSESVVMGVTAAMLVRQKNISCLFAETKSTMPDSRAAAKTMALLGTYLGIDLDTAPLLAQAELFEGKIKGIMEQANSTAKESQAKQMSYFG